MIQIAVMILLILIFIAAFFRQGNWSRFYIAMFYVSIVLIHKAFFDDLDGLSYFFTDAIGNMLVIMSVFVINPYLRMGKQLQIACFASIIVSAVGWVFWVTYNPPLIPNIMGTLIHVAVLVIFLTKERDKEDVGNSRVNSRRFGFRINASPSIPNHFKNKGKT